MTNKTSTRIAAVAMAAIMALAMASGCKGTARVTDNQGASQNSFEGEPEILQYASIGESDGTNGSQTHSDAHYNPSGILTLATFNADNIRDLVVGFNAANPDCHIDVIDYSEFGFGDGRNSGITRLNTEMISGSAPDILDISDLPQYREYAARGILADLYPFIGTDPKYSREDFVEGAFQAAEIDDGLYLLFPSFSINAMVGHPSVVGSDMGWSMDEFEAVLDAYPNADMPLGMWLTDMSFLQMAISAGIDEYINWEAGTAHFDTEDFIQLLEYAKTFTNNVKWGDEGVTYVPPVEAIAAGRQIMHVTAINSFFDFHKYKGYFGGDITLKSYPTESKRNCSLNVELGFAITETSKNKEAAWAFIRAILDENWQLGNTSFRFPTNLAAFNQRALGEKWSDDEPDLVTPQEDVKKILAFINDTSGIRMTGLVTSLNGWNMDETIWDIVSEGASDYFSGKSSAEDASRTIQSRVSILVSERS